MSLEGACNGCHDDIVPSVMNGLHTNLNGYKTAIDARCGCDYDIATSEGFQLRCAGCHTGCGECHISRPNSVGGGFIAGHEFRARPHMTNQCTACHGSRVGVDYQGQIDEDGDDVMDYPPDLHWGQLFYTCERCHKANEMHNQDVAGNDLGQADHRYAMAAMPRCEDCHGDEVDANEYHDAHWGLVDSEVHLQCQVCHSQPYKNCNTCHPNPAGDEEGYSIEPSYVMFKIGKNTQPDVREYDYTVVRHVPVHPTDTFNEAMWGGLELSGFDDIPTWKYASPHNIKLWTPQTTVEQGQDCGAACHDTQGTYNGYYLRETDLYDDGTPLPDYDANLPVVIEEFH